MEAAHHELRRIDSAVGVSVVCPGNIATGMPNRARPATGPSAHPQVMERIEAAVVEGVALGADPATVVEAVVQGVESERFWLLPQPEIAWAASDRVRRMAEGEAPVDLLG
ncbi:MAG: hypothetical protein R2716_06025 [Microthrixaceae bacterium]